MHQSDQAKLLLLDITVQGSPSNGSPLPLQTSLYRDPLLLVTFGNHPWKPVQIHPLQDPPPTSADIWWLLKYVRSMQKGSRHPTGMISCWQPRSEDIVFTVVWVGVCIPACTWAGGVSQHAPRCGVYPSMHLGRSVCGRRGGVYTSPFRDGH